MHHPRLAALCASLTTVSVFACASGPNVTLAPENLDLSGRWNLNTDLSDDPGKMRPEGGLPDGTRGGRPGGMGGGRPTGGMDGGQPSGGRGGRGGMGGRAPNQIDPQRMMQTMRMAIPPPRSLVVEHHDSTVAIRNAGGRSIELFTDWEKVHQEIGNDGELDIRARWEGRALHVEREVNGGGKVTQSYSLSSDGERLLVETWLEMGGSGREQVFRYVYDRPQNQR